MVMVPGDVDDAVMIRWDEKTNVSHAYWSGLRRSCFSRGRLLADIMSSFRGRRIELSIVTTAGLTIFVPMSADRHCWNGDGVILPRYPHGIHAPTQSLSSPSYKSTSFCC